MLAESLVAASKRSISFGFEGLAWQPFPFRALAEEIGETSGAGFLFLRAHDLAAGEVGQLLTKGIALGQAAANTNRGLR